ncbi:MAG: hypothetical protein Q9174_003070 [Haloplaca sp. 1 TL-2023]
MGLFSKNHKSESHAHLAPSPSPQYLNGQPQAQGYASQSPLYPGTQPYSAMTYGAPSMQEQHLAAQQYAPQQPFQHQQQYPQRIPSPAAHPSPAYHASSPAAFLTPGPRILHLTREGFSQRKAHIYEADNITPAYDFKISRSAEWSFSKPHNEIISATTGLTVGTVRFSSLSRHVDLVIHGRPLKLTSNGWTTRGYSFPSNIGQCRWEASSMMKSAYACTTERGECLAKCDQNILMSMHGKGTIEIVNRNLPAELMDELVVTALAMIELERRATKQAMNSAASA